MPVRPCARSAPLPPGESVRAGRHVVGQAAGPRPTAITGERAAWDGRAPDSWEHVMPWGEPTEEQRRLLAAGNAVRVQLPVAVVRR